MIRASDRLVIASAVAVLLISLTAQPLTQDTYLGPSWLLVLVLAGATVGLRRARLTTGFVLGAQAVLLAALLFVLSSLVPNSRGLPWYAHYAGLWAQGIEHMQTSVAPMNADPGVKIIFVSVIGVLFVLTDLVVSGLDRPAWGIMPPAAAFAVPALGLPTDTWISAFLCLALGYLGILIADGLNRTGRWTRGLSRDSAEGYGSATTVVWRAAGLIGVPALIATAVLGMALPTLTVPGLSLGNGPGGGGPLQLGDPTLDLRRNLQQGENSVVLHYTSNRPGGLYLRMASLPSFDAGGWSNVQMRLESGTRLSVIPGVSGEPGEPRSTEVSILDFGSEYLPLPYAPRSVEVDGDWAYDPNSLVMLSVARAGNRIDATRNLTYTVDSRDLEPNAATLARAVAGTPPDENTTAEVPPDLPDDLIELTHEVTKGADTDAEKAWAIQEFLRELGVHLQHRPPARERLSRPAELPAPRPGGLLRAIRHLDGDDGPDRRHSLPGRRRIPARQAHRGRHLGGLDPRHARLAGTVLRRFGVGAVRADTVDGDRYAALVDPPPVRVAER